MAGMDTDTRIVPVEIILPGDTSLPELAAKANAAHHLVHDAAVDMVTHAIEAGEALASAKGRVAHGEWLPWLAENFDASERLAQSYMQIAANPQRAALLEETSLRGVLKALGSGEDTPHVAKNSGENEWYTPPEYIAAAREVMGGIDLDPASSVKANSIVQADQFFTKADDGLAQEWSGRVWLNPPYENTLIVRFVDKLTSEYGRDRIEQACVLVNNATDTAWFRQLANVANALCLVTGRVRFLDPDMKPGAPLQGQAVLYFGDQGKKFGAVHRQFGHIWYPDE